MTTSAWIASVALVGCAWRMRPPPRRVRSMLEDHGDHAGTGMLTTLGRFARRCAGRPPDVAADRFWGRALVAVAALAAVDPVLGLAAGVAIWAVPRWRRSRQRAQRQRRLQDSLADAVDLLVLAAGSGAGVRGCIEAVADHGRGEMAQELRSLLGEVRRGRRLAESLEALPSRLGDAVRPLVGVMLASERYGAPLVPALASLGRQFRDDRRRRAEEAARRVPVQLLFPLVLCILPAFALLTVVPLLAGSLGALDI